jgi:sortase A
MRIRRAVRPLAWTLLACLLLTAGWAVYMVTDPLASHRQQAVQQQLHQQWRSAPPAAAVRAHLTAGDRGSGRRSAGSDPIQLKTSQPFALIRVPAFGRTWQFAIVEGTGASQLALGPGHVPGTGLPGRPGNFVVAAHDVTAGNPFLHLRILHKPDKIYIRTRNYLYKYVVTSERVVKYTDVGVEYPVPGHPRQAPSRARITLITCTPVTLAFTPWRIVVTGELVRASART